MSPRPSTRQDSRASPLSPEGHGRDQRPATSAMTSRRSLSKQESPAIPPPAGVLERRRSLSKPDSRVPSLHSEDGLGRDQRPGSSAMTKRNSTRSAAPETNQSTPKKRSVTANNVNQQEVIGEGAAQGGMKRQLSFVDVTIDDLKQLMEEEMPGLDWMEKFWNRALTAPPASRTLGFRTLANWVGVFNRWQAMGGWKPGQAPSFVNAMEMQELMQIPMPRVLEFVKLFDPPGYERVSLARSPAEYAKVKMPMHAFLTACIILSQTISKKQKIRFLLGVFDEDDSLTIEEEEFSAHLQALFAGLSAIFCIKGARPRARIEPLAKQMFSRMSDHTAENSTSLPFSLVEEWLHGDLDDPLATTFALLLQRFAPAGMEDDPEQFEDEDRKFRLSHTSPVDPPLETAAALDASFLNRYEVVLAEAIYNRCLYNSCFEMPHKEAEMAINREIEPAFWIEKLHPALHEMDTIRGHGVKLTLTTFFKKLCPRAGARHLRMFHNWLKENEELEELKVSYVQSQQRLKQFDQYLAAPKLPSRIRQELVAGWQDHLSSTLRTDVEDDGAKEADSKGVMELEKEEYVAKFCPAGFRAHAGHPVVDQVLREMLAGKVARQGETLQQRGQLFAPKKAATETSSLLRSKFVKPKVSSSTWQSWNYALELLEVHDDPVSKAHLQRTRLICPALVENVYELVDNGDGFTREAFLKTMSRLTSCRSQEH